jgi:oxygen-independent coproporphyrinogen-3 oxidase
VPDGARHLYIHLPFCASRCGYCDFVTVVGHADRHGAYVDALLEELELERHLLAPELESVYLGGGTPTLTAAVELERLLGALPPALEVTVEANPETVTPSLAALLSRNGVDRVSIGAQTFNTALLDVLDRRARPDDVRHAMHRLADAGIGNRSLDLIYGIPGQTPADLVRDHDEAVAMEPEHNSPYEQEANPGTRFTHPHRVELQPQTDRLESYIEHVVERLTTGGYRWYETANFCRLPDRAGGRDLRARHNLGYWLGHDYLGLGVGAVSTIENRRWRNAPSLHRYLAALGRGKAPERELEALSAGVRATERVMLGLRLDEPRPLAGLGDVIDAAALDRLAAGGLAVQREGSVTLTPRGRLLGGGVTARLLA